MNLEKNKNETAESNNKSNTNTPYKMLKAVISILLAILVIVGLCLLYRYSAGVSISETVHETFNNIASMNQ